MISGIVSESKSWSTHPSTTSKRPVRTVEDSHQSDPGAGDVLVESLTMSPGNLVSHQPGNSPRDFPALVDGLLGAGGATVLSWDVTALLLVNLPGLAVAGRLVHSAALSPWLLLGDLGTFLLGDLGAAHTSRPAVPLLHRLPPVAVHQVGVLSGRQVRRV